MYIEEFGFFSGFLSPTYCTFIILVTTYFNVLKYIKKYLKYQYNVFLMSEAEDNTKKINQQKN